MRPRPAPAPGAGARARAAARRQGAGARQEAGGRRGVGRAAAGATALLRAASGHVAPCKLGDVSSETYTMEAIVDERDAGGGVSEYRVKWEGWPEADATWEPWHSKVAGTLLDAWHAPGARTAMTWTAEEDAALRAAVAKHGTGRWTEAAAEPGLGRRNNEQLRGRCARLPPPPPNPASAASTPTPYGPCRLSHAARALLSRRWNRLQRADDRDDAEVAAREHERKKEIRRERERERRAERQAAERQGKAPQGPPPPPPPPPSASAPAAARRRRVARRRRSDGARARGRLRQTSTPRSSIASSIRARRPTAGG